MKKTIIPLFLLLLVVVSSCSGNRESRIIWQIGQQDGTPSGFALAPDKYADFLNEDFGWEDRFFLIGQSTPEKDFPYALPGPADGWGARAIQPA